MLALNTLPAMTTSRTPPRRNRRIIRPTRAIPDQENDRHSPPSSSPAIPRSPTQTTGRPTARAFSANTTGNRPAPASRPTGVGVVTSVSPSRSGGIGLAGVQAEVLLQPADLLDQVGQVVEAEQDALGLALGPGGGA